MGLGGLIAIEVFRYYRHGTREEMGSFRLFGLSIFWGLIVLFVNSLLLLLGNNIDAIVRLMGNPFVAGFSNSFIGAIGGLLVALAVNSGLLRKLSANKKGG